MDAPVRTRHIQSNGFTLVEMLVALIVGSLLMIGVHQVFVAGLTTQSTTSSQMEVDRKAQVALDEITSLLREAAPSILTGTSAVLDNFDSQHPDRIHFAGAPLSDLEPAAGSDVRYWVSNQKLYRNVGGSGYTGGAILATGVTDFRFTFYKNAVGDVPTNTAAETVRVGVALTITNGVNWSTLHSTVKLRNT